MLFTVDCKLTCVDLLGWFRLYLSEFLVVVSLLTNDRVWIGLNVFVCCERWLICLHGVLVPHSKRFAFMLDLVDSWVGLHRFCLWDLLVRGGFELWVCLVGVV